MIYLDSAAIVKMVRRERGTGELVGWLNDRSDEPLVSSSLVEVEVPRALRRSAPQALAGCPRRDHQALPVRDRRDGPCHGIRL